MRSQAYLLFEIVAWPALAWCGAEVALRMAAGAFDGLASTAITGAMAHGSTRGSRGTAVARGQLAGRSAANGALRLSPGRPRDHLNERLRHPRLQPFRMPLVEPDDIRDDFPPAPVRV